MNDPPYIYPDYRSTVLRGPKKPLVILPHTLSELSGPAFGESAVAETDADLTLGHAGEPLGERIIVSGQLLGDDGRPIPGALIEVWQANSAGR
jgi:protocatechuate 3,4-dioxygenase beta subunit